MIAAAYDAEAPASAFLDVREPADVLLLVDEDVVGLHRAEAMAVDLQRAMVVVDVDVIEERQIEAPDHAAAGLRQDIGQVLAGIPAPDADGEELGPAQVGAPGFEPVVRRMARAAELEVVGGLCQCVAVEDDLDVAAAARRAADQLVLATVSELPQIGEGPVRRGYAQIVLLDSAAHFRDQRLLQRLRRRQQRLGIGVFGLEIGPDIRIKQGRVAQHLLPLLVLQPGIVVSDRDAMQRASRGAPRRDR